MWGDRRRKYIVALTRDALSPDVHSQVSEQIAGSGIELRTIQWSSVLEVALRRLRERHTSPRQAIFLQAFVDFFREYYVMKSYQVEVMVKKDNLLNAEKVYLNGYMYVGGPKDIQLPLYFGPCFTRESVGRLPGIQQPGVSYISRVIKVRRSSADRLKASPESVADGEIQGHELWSYWRNGLRAITSRAEDESWPDEHQIQLYFLSEPVALNHTVRGPMQIPPGYGTTVFDLLSRSDPTRHPVE